MTSITDNLITIQKRIKTAEQHFGRPPHSVQLLAVSKTFSASNILELYQAGQLDFAESYLQEALTKMATLADYPLRWHFIGNLQSNKLKTIAQHFSWVHSLYRLAHAQKLSEARSPGLPPLNVCIEVKTDPHPGKGGATLSELPSLLQNISCLPNIKVRGLMTLPPQSTDVEEQRKYFSILTKFFNANQAAIPTFDTLSMGTTGDLEAAIAEGATLVRIGTGLFGPREPKK